MSYKRILVVLVLGFCFFGALGCYKYDGITVYFYSSDEVIAASIEQLELLPQPQKEGYIFEGWYFDQNYQNPFSQDKLKKLNEDIILYAKWSPIEYTINLYDESMEPINIKASFNSSVSLSNYCDLEGYKLIGYSELQKSDQVIYNDGFLMPARDLNLYVQKSPIQVSFETFGTDCIDIHIYNELRESNSLPIPVKDGYRFEGWYLDKGFDNKFDLNNFCPKENFILYAKWEAVYYKVDFLIDDNIQSIEYLEGSYITPPQIPFKRGYNFLGWYYNEQKFDFSQPISCDITLIAKWEPIVYKIDYHLNGGQALVNAVSQYTISFQDIALPTPKKSGYKFLGWYDAQDNLWTKIPAYTAQDVTLEARWQERQIQSIEILNLPQKLDYFLGEKIDITGLIIQANFDNGETELIDYTNQDLALSPIQEIIGKQIIRVSYQGVCDNFEILVNDIQIAYIQVTIAKTEYIEGQELDFDSVFVNVFYNNAKYESIKLKPQYLSDYDMSRLGKQNIIVNYMGLETYFEIEIKAKSLVKIKVNDYQKEYDYLEELNTQVELLLYYDNGTTDTKCLENAQIYGYDNTKAGNQTLTLVYNDNDKTMTCEFDITVLPPPKTIQEISICTYPKTEYILDEELDLSGGIIKVKYLYSHYYPDEYIFLDSENVSITGFDSSKEADRLKLTVNYKGAVCEYYIKVTDYYGAMFDFFQTQEGYIITGLKINSPTIIIPAMYKGRPIIQIQTFALWIPAKIEELIIQSRTHTLFIGYFALEDHSTNVFIYCDQSYVLWENLYDYQNLNIIYSN